MKLQIAKTFDFDAAHWLPFVPKEHKCSRVHGHTYRCEIICAGELDERGMVCDYDEIAAAWRVIGDRIDHQLLNNIPGLENPTTEVLAPYILGCLSANASIPVVAVRVYESSSTYCEVSR